jgi:hypothetical protein
MTIVREGRRQAVSQLGRMGKLKAASVLIALLLFTAPAMAQSPVVINASLGVRTFVTNIALPPNVVRTSAVIGLTRQANWFDAPANWDWENVLDSAGFVQSVNVYVTLNTNNTTQANGTTICCWTYAETSLVATDVNGAQYAFPVQVYAQ